MTPAQTGAMSDGATLPFSVAPMMDWTDRHCRYFHRLLAPTARLYTEMVHCAAVIHGDRERLLDPGGRGGIRTLPEWRICRL